jgi:hypothetical protein
VFVEIAIQIISFGDLFHSPLNMYAFGCQFGDYYTNDDWVWRGTTLSEPGIFDDNALDILGYLPSDDSRLIALHLKTPIAQVDFSNAPLPPEVPFGGYANTSVILEHISAAEAMRLLHGFFQTQVLGLVTKVSLSKCSMSAEVCLDDAWRCSSCKIKVRLFQKASSRGSTQLVAEFRRQAGDSYAFAQTFRYVSEYLPNCLVGDRVSQANQFCFGAGLAQATPAIDNMQPLVDALLSSTHVEAQAESLAALLSLPNRLDKQLETNTAFDHVTITLRYIEKSPSFCVSYPASRILSMCRVNSKKKMTELDSVRTRSPKSKDLTPELDHGRGGWLTLPGTFLPQ